MTLNFISFEDWLKLHPALELEDCPECEGEGQHECSCGHRHTCDECYGTGKVGDPRQDVNARRDQHEAEKAAIAAKLAAWAA